MKQHFELKSLCKENIPRFKKDMQEAFQQGAIAGFGEISEEILPESHIDRSLNAEGAVAYEAFADGESAGGAIVVINENTQHNHLDFLYVKVSTQSMGIGQKIWNKIEELHPETKIWETVTPYFDKRNIHFYINKCGFHAVEFYNKHHPDPNEHDDEMLDEENLYDETLKENNLNDETPDERTLNDEYFDGMFRFEKVMK